MNLFVLSNTPEDSAIYHVDKHVSKMPTEVFQMMGSALIRHGAKPCDMPLTKKNTPLKGGYPNHCCTRWVGDTDSNFYWAANYGIALCCMYTKVYGKIHSTQKGIIQMLRFQESRGLIPKGNLTDFAIAIKEDKECRKLPFFNNLSIVDKYRTYYILDKSHIAAWKDREKPEWYNNEYLEILKNAQCK